ncbi:MAG TPA: uracil-DNA glycosylase [Janthinobacterium sp.]|nr:uracil-DNA glycosylase [Janthinobacterium sp.]
MNQGNQGSGRSAVFLQEMGVGPLWRLRHAAPPEATAETDGDAQDAPPAPFDAPVMPAALPDPDETSTAWFDDAPAPAAPVPVSAAAIAAMDWAQLKAAAARCTRCALSRSRKSVVFGRGDKAAAWLVVGAAPGRADEKEGRAISGEAGKLLDNMLLAAGRGTDKDVYVTNLVKCRPQGPDGAERAPAPEEMAACRPYLERELALTQGRTIVTLGQAALKGLLGGAAPASRGTLHRLGQVAVAATYHPEDLLRQGDNKARAWADLCLANSAHGEGSLHQDDGQARGAPGLARNAHGDAA